jgi:hypothetical protein
MYQATDRYLEYITFNDMLYWPSSQIFLSTTKNHESHWPCDPNSLNNRICALLEIYIASSGNGLPTFRDNVGKGLRLDAAQYPRRAQISSTSGRKPEITGSPNNTLYTSYCNDWLFWEFANCQKVLATQLWFLESLGTSLHETWRRAWIKLEVLAVVKIQFSVYWDAKCSVLW